MKHIVKDFSDLTASKQLMATKSSRVGKFVIYTSFGLLVLGIILASLIKIDVVVKGQGLIGPDKPIYELEMMKAGRIDQIFIEDGQEVKAGDTLLVLEQEQLINQKVLVQSKIDELEAKVTTLEEMKASIHHLENRLSPREGHGYIDAKSRIEVILSEHKNILTKIHDIEEHIFTYQEEYRLYSLYKESIDTGRDMFADGHEAEDHDHEAKGHSHEAKGHSHEAKGHSHEAKGHSHEANTQEHLYGMVYNDYLYYKHASQKLLLEYLEAEKVYEDGLKAYEGGKISKEDLASDKRKMTIALYDYDAYSFEKLKEVMEKLYVSGHSVDHQAIEIDKLYVGQGEDKELLLIHQQLMIVEKEFMDNKTLLDDYYAQRDLIEVAINNNSIKAPYDGWAQYESIQVNDRVEMGEIVGSIIPKGNLFEKVRMQIHEKDIADIEVGDPVLYEVLALDGSERTLHGYVTSIAQNPHYTDGVNVYDVEGSVEGANDQMKVNMRVLCKVVDDRESVMTFFLKKMKLLNK